jgi:hypothetical protein
MKTRISRTKALLIALFFCVSANAQEFNGLNMGMGNLFQMSKAKTRSLSPENFKGEKGAGGMADPVKDKETRNQAVSANAASTLGKGWKVNPCIDIDAGETMVIADIDGPGAIQQIWMTPTGEWRKTIIRMYWDGETNPSVEAPVGDFFCAGWGVYAPLSSLAVCVNPGSAFNCYWQMPFRKHCKITMENRDKKPMRLYYQINYTLTEVPDDAAYFHAQYRLSDPTEKALHTILDGVKGRGQYVGTYMAIQPTNNGWWGEGEIKFYMDGDTSYPTICGTGTEDYFCGSYNFENQRTHQFEEYCTPYAGLHQVIRPDGVYRSQQRYGLYRWHILDPVRFEKNLKVTIQDLGWRNDGTYLDQKSFISTVAYWYQAEPHATFPELPANSRLEIAGPL